ncbi:hypothetical protein [Marinoscillum sp.]|uniref:hypothetical protein n=1 Tax=Marinoscillum sp. TaxID=2024838 RepID=UPI003BAA6831
MDLIREMVNVVEQDRPKTFNLLIPRDSKLKKLYKLVAAGGFLDDVSAASKLYQSDPGDKRFIMLKGSLINKLSELILATNHSELNRRNYTKIKFQCERQMTIARKLLYVNVYHNAERIARRVLRKARKYDLIEVELECFLTLRKINYLKGFTSEVEKYQQAASGLMEQAKVMDVSKGLVQVALSETKFVRSQSHALVTKCRGYMEELSAYHERYESPFLRLYYLRVALVAAHQQNDFVEWGRVLEAVRAHLKAYAHLETEHVMLEVNISSLKYFIATAELGQARPVLKKLIKSTSFEAFNRFEVLVEEFQLLMHRGAYGEALKLLEMVHEEPRFLELDKMDRAAWAIRSAYLFVIGHMLGEPMKVQGFDFKKLHKFYHDCAPISKDKTGYNLQFVIVRVILLRLKNTLEYDSEANNLKVYYQRYIKENALPRTRAFYQCFVRLVRERFEEKIFYRERDELIKNLADYNDHLEYNELIRFELLILQMEQLTSTRKEE